MKRLVVVLLVAALGPLSASRGADWSPTRTGYVIPHTPQGQYPMMGQGGCCGNCEQQSTFRHLLSWIAFRPEAGKALPKLNPQPYIGPITGTVPCCPTAMLQTSPTPALRTVAASPSTLPARGCQGGCLPPSSGAAYPAYQEVQSENAPPVESATTPVGRGMPVQRTTVVPAAYYPVPAARPSGRP
jgi:hypothetical protein